MRQLFSVFLHVAEKVAQEKDIHAQHEGDAHDAYQSEVGGEEILEHWRLWMRLNQLNQYSFKYSMMKACDDKQTAHPRY